MCYFGGGDLLAKQCIIRQNTIQKYVYQKKSAEEITEFFMYALKKEKKNNLWHNQI